MNEPRAVGQIYNLGSGQEVTIEGLARLVVELTGSSSPIQFIPYEEAYVAGFEDMRRRVPDTTKLRNLLGYAPDSDLRGILEDVIASFRENPDSQ